MQELNTLLKEVSIVLLEDKLILLSVNLEPEPLKDAHSSVDFSNSLLEGLVAKIYALELRLAWVLHHIACVD